MPPGEVTPPFVAVASKSSVLGLGSGALRACSKALMCSSEMNTRSKSGRREVSYPSAESGEGPSWPVSAIAGLERLS